MPNDESEISSGDRIYTWTIRSLYALGISLNIWFLYLQSVDTPEGQRVRDEIAKVRASIVKPWKERRHFRRQVNETIVEAWVIVDEANKEN